MKYEDFRKGYSSTFKKNEELMEAKKQPITEISNSFIARQPQVKTQPVKLAVKEPLALAMPQMQFDTLQVFRENLSNCLSIVDDEVMKGYLTKLEHLDIVPLEKSELDDLERNPIQFFRITELVYQEEEFSVHKLATIFNSMSKKPCILALMIRNDGKDNQFYLGVRATSKENSTGTMMQMLQHSLTGIFTGSKVTPYYNDQMKKDMEGLDISCLSSVSCVADFKQKETGSLKDNSFVQGIEKFVESMQGRKYTAIFLAENMGYDELVSVRREYEQIYSQLSPFVNMQMGFSSSSSNTQSSGSSEGTSEGKSHGYGLGQTQGANTSHTSTIGSSISRGETDTHGTSESVSDGKTDTIGHSHTVSESESNTTSHTFSGGVSANISNMVSAAVTIGASVMPFGIGGSVAGTVANAVTGGAGVNIGYSYGRSKTKTRGTSDTESTSQSISKVLTHGINQSHSDSITRNESKGKSETSGFSSGMSFNENIGTNSSKSYTQNRSISDTSGMGQNLSFSVKNMSFQTIISRLEKQLKRMEACESTGMWKFAGYFIGNGAAETESAANIYRSIVSGADTGIEYSATNTWHDSSKLKYLSQYVKNFIHPVLEYKGFDYGVSRIVDVTPAVMVNTNELAIHMGLPYHSIKGLPVVQHPVFAQEVIRGTDIEKSFSVGKVYHMGHETDTDVELDVNSLNMHTLITGSTGSGKSNAAYHILNNLQKKNIPFLVIEPAKGEYKRVFSNVRCYGTNPQLGPLLKINPFSFPQDIHVLEHIDRLIEIINVCWPMYAAMPSVLKEAIEQAYISAGWDMEQSVNIYGYDLYPTFVDVLLALNNSIKSSEYSEDTKGDYIGALSTRLKSLTNGINGSIFGNDEIDLDQLFNESAIVDISRIGSMETKSLIMGMLVLKLQEYRMANAKDMNSPLRHLTVLEEAHNLLKKTSTEQSVEGANVAGKSVEMLTNAIAEMRTYGEGFVIVDQAPSMLDTAAVRNTNTKIVLRLPEGNDRKIIGESMALTNTQVDKMSKLSTGVAAIYQNDWQEAVLCKLPIFKAKSDSSNVSEWIYVPKKTQYNNLLHKLLKKEYTIQEVDEISIEILRTNGSASVRKYLINNLESKNVLFSLAMTAFLKKYRVYDEAFEEAEYFEDNDKLLEHVVQKISLEFEGFNRDELTQIVLYISDQYDGEKAENFRKYVEERLSYA